MLHKTAQLLRLHPTLRTAYATYAQTFSETQAVKAHRYARAAGVMPDPRMANRRDWQTPQGGGLFATGVGGELTGRGADLLLIDDPVSNREQADSPTFRDKTFAWYEDVAETRLEPGGSVVLLMTRWHEDDLAGRLIKNRPGEWSVIRIPALADHLDALGRDAAPDPLGREVGAALWPERYSRGVLEDLREKKPYTFASLYQGLPRPRDATLFKDATFYSALPGAFRTVIGVDLAYSRKRKANHSAVVVYAVVGDSWHVRFVERWQADINGTLAKLDVYRRSYPGAEFHVEANGPQLATFDLLQGKGFPVVPVHRAADKYAEAQAYAEAWNSGRVLVPDSESIPAPWLPDFLDEHRNFTGMDDAEDDQVDAAINAYEDNVHPVVTGIFTGKGRA